MKYSLWIVEHETIYEDIAYKIKDTNSVDEVNKWIKNNHLSIYGLNYKYKVASRYLDQIELNADYLQQFEVN